MAYAVGGWSHEDWCAPLASVEALDLAADGAAFGAAAPLAVARGDKALAATGEALYVVGGEHNNGCATGSAPVDDVEALGDGAGEWSVEADIPEERFRTAAAAVGDYLYVFGGQAAESTSCAAPRPFFKTFAVRAMMLRFLISSSTEGFVRRVDRHSLPLSRPRAPRDRRPPRRAPRDDAPPQARASRTASPSRTTSGACRSTRTTTTGATTATTTTTSRTPSPSRPPSPSPRSCSSPSPAPRSSRPAARRRRRPRTRSRSRARSSCRTARTCRPSCEEDASGVL